MGRLSDIWLGAPRTLTLKCILKSQEVRGCSLQKPAITISCRPFIKANKNFCAAPLYFVRVPASRLVRGAFPFLTAPAQCCHP